MSDVIEFAKILRRNYSLVSDVLVALDAAIEELESRGREVVITGPTDEQRGEYPPGVGPGEFGTAGEMPRYPKWAKPPRDGIFAPREDVAIGRWLAGETPASISTDYDESENWFWHVVRQALWRYRRDEKIEVKRLRRRCAHWMSKWGRAWDRIATLESRGRQEEPSAP